MKYRVCLCFCAAMTGMPFPAPAADSYFKALSNNVVWSDSAQWTNGVPATGENAKATILEPGWAFNVNLAEEDSPWLLGKFDCRPQYNNIITFKGGEFLLRGTPAELKGGATAPVNFQSRLMVESNLLVYNGAFLVKNTNRFDKGTFLRFLSGLFFDFPNGQSTLPELKGCGAAGFINAGGGTLTVTNPTSFAGGYWYIGNGTLRTVKTVPAALADTNAPPLLVASPLLHLDASRADSFTLTNGIQVVEWRDLSGNGYHARIMSVYPTRLENELGALPAVDFGAFKSGQYMKWATPITTARSVFWVVGSLNGGGILLGGTSTAHFCRGGTFGAVPDDPLWSSTDSTLTTVNLNGEAVDGRAAGLSGGYDLVSVVSETDRSADGLAFDRSDSGRTGGQRLAELIIYDRALSDTERRQVEHYLYGKWLARTTDLRHVQVITDSAIETLPQDSDTTVRRLQGRGTLTKSGTGTLRLEESHLYPGVLRLAEGALALTNVAAGPTSAQIAAAPVFHLDASLWASAMTLTNDRVYAWGDAEGGTMVAQLTNALARPPVLMRNALNGLPVVDFGCQYSRQFLDWNEPLSNIVSVIWVVGSQNGGNFLLTGVFSSPTDFHRGPSASLNPDWLKLESGIFTAANMVTWVDGRLCDNRTTPLSGGFQIISTRYTGSYKGVACRIGQDRGFFERSGGLRLAELLIYSRALTEEERVDTEASLRAKWLPAPAALSTLEVTGQVGLRAENDLALDTLTGTGTVTKTGPGRVTLNGLAAFTGSLETDGGAFTFKSPGNAPSLPLAGYAAWFDASRTNTMTIDAATQRVTRWEDAANPALAATNALSGAPLLLAGALNNLPVLDFNVAGSGRYLHWTAPAEGIRTVFMVLGSQNGGGYLLGSSHNTSLFSRGYNNAAAALFDSYTAQASDAERERTWLSRSFAWIDGVPVFPNLKGLNGGYQLVTFLTGGDVKANGFAHNGAGSYNGAQRLAEVVVYDKPLADDDRKAVEAYLSAKWFSLAIHGYTVPGAPTVPGLTLANAAAFELGAGETNSVGWLTGAGSLVKTGAGTLDIAGSTLGFDGTLNVREGVLRYTAEAFGASSPVTNQLVLNLDASRTNSLVLAGGKATEWRDASGNGRYAYAPGSAPAYYADAGLGGRPAVDFGTYAVGSPYMMFDAPLTNAQTVFWVLGSQNGGGFLLGGSTVCDWHRGSRVNNELNPVTTENRLYGFGASANVTGGKTYIDGVLLPVPHAVYATNVLNGAYQMIETVATGATRADGLAFDRTNLERRGGQRLAELLIFSRAVTEEERLGVETYLNWKWFGRASSRVLYMPFDGASADTVRVAAGATFELGGFTQNTRALVGGGTIGGGSLSVSGLVDLSDPDAGTLTVNGDLTIEDGATVRVSPGHTVDVNGTLTIGGAGLLEWHDGLRPVAGSTAVFTCDSIQGAENLSLWNDGDKYAPRFHLSAYADAGTVYVLVKPTGAMILLR
ncbi:MAG: hypothetical protein PHV28_11020 [Kiritimatiellae bacterium]|nr:hypothetical protein [Kiritimatiellia bacterium]